MSKDFDIPEIHKALFERSSLFFALFNKLLVPLRLSVLAILSKQKASIYEDSIIDLLKNLTAEMKFGKNILCQARSEDGLTITYPYLEVADLGADQNEEKRQAQLAEQINYIRLKVMILDEIAKDK